MGKRYAIIDLETTGGKASRNKITEIGIVLHDGEKIIDTFETLVNPECYIPYGITQLTGISQEMVADAPKFYEVARKVVEMTEGAIFVAHNVRFDYSFLREEFARLGYTYTRKQLCTVRLSRKVFPGLRSYSLDNLIREFDLQINNRHRAMGDALATTQLFERILAKEKSEEKVSELVNLGVRQALLPANWTVDKLHGLPETCGVYYFHNKAGEVVYVGKSINIKKRVAEHFRQKTEKASKLQKHVYDLSYELTGSELVAYLLESHEIKRLSPPINRAQRLRHFPYVVHCWEDDEGYLCFGMKKTNARERKKLRVLAEYPTMGRAKGSLKRAMEEYELCARLCGVQNGSGACFEYHLRQCEGACIGKEAVDSYNQRAEEARERLRTIFDEDFIVLDQGRRHGEKSVVLIESGRYRGFGYVEEEDLKGDFQLLYDCIQPYPGNAETSRIILRYLSKNKEAKVVKVGSGISEIGNL
ncbi:MAG: exonuclease domain-containing protein [Saprospiraceae bacterium]|nr:exonuclease domain-containing protein [Saprospiraceae bacterium]